jgi:hypothetical protein
MDASITVEVCPARPAVSDVRSRPSRLVGWRRVANGSWLFGGRCIAGVEEVAMLEGKTRIPPVDVETLPNDLREALEEQRKLRGTALYPYLFYARNPARP